MLKVHSNRNLTGCDKGVATLSQDLHEVVGQITTSQIQTHDGMGKSITLIDGDIVRHTITGVQHNTYGTMNYGYNDFPETGQYHVH